MPLIDLAQPVRSIREALYMRSPRVPSNGNPAWLVSCALRFLWLTALGGRGIQAKRAQASSLRKATLEGDWGMVVNLIRANVSGQHQKRFLYAVYRQVSLEDS